MADVLMGQLLLLNSIVFLRLISFEDSLNNLSVIGPMLMLVEQMLTVD